MGMLGMPQATSANQFLCKGNETKVHLLQETNVFGLHASSLLQPQMSNMQVVPESEVQRKIKLQQGTRGAFGCFAQHVEKDEALLSMQNK